MKKKIWIAIGVVVIIGVFVGVNIWNNVTAEGITVETTTLTDQEITAAVMTPGTLKLKNEQNIYASPEKGEVDEILVEEGDKVEEGDDLIRYANESLRLEKEQNALAIETGYLRINNVKKQLDRLKEKEKDLAKEIGEKEAKSTVDTERDQLDMERRMADIELKQTQLQKDAIEQQLKDLTVKSDIDGTVLTVDEDAAQATNQMEPKPVIRIANLDQLIVEGVISEYDTLKVQEGQSVTLRSDVVPDEEWTGEVIHIGFLPEQDSTSLGGDSSAVEYAVVVAVESDEINLKPGFQLIIEIETERRTAPTLPLSAVVEDQTDEAEHIVYVVNDGVAERRVVKVGAVGSDYIEITDGLEAADHVIVEPPANITDGAEVTVQ